MLSKILALLIISMSLLGLTSCFKGETQTVISTKVSISTITTTETKVVISGDNTQKLPESLKALNNLSQDGIAPAEVKIGNYYPGATAEQEIWVHNGGDQAKSYKIIYRIPDNTRETDDTKTAYYSMPPILADKWVGFADDYITVNAHDTIPILVTLNMPKDAVSPGKWEFWVSVMEDSNNTIQTELCERWLVSMR
jgi:hypothetical protein